MCERTRQKQGEEQKSGHGGWGRSGWGYQFQISNENTEFSKQGNCLVMLRSDRELQKLELESDDLASCGRRKDDNNDIKSQSNDRHRI